MAENTLSLNFGDNEEMRAFVDSMSPAVGGSISLSVTVGVTEYDESRLTGVVTNVDRDPYGDYEQELSPAAEEFTGETEPNVNMFETGNYQENLLGEESGASPFDEMAETEEYA